MSPTEKFTGRMWGIEEGGSPNGGGEIPFLRKERGTGGEDDAGARERRREWEGKGKEDKSGRGRRKSHRRTAIHTRQRA